MNSKKRICGQEIGALMSDTEVTQSKVTIVIPTFNRSELLRTSLGSVLSQDHSDFRVIVLDNASSDATEAVVQSFASLRVTYIRNERNIGMTANLNRAFTVN